MKLALLGHGRMGRVIAAQARAAGHEVAAIVTSGNAADAARLLPGHDVAIDFSVPAAVPAHAARSEEHTSELQSRLHLVCRLLLEKKKKWGADATFRRVRACADHDECPPGR